MIDILKTFRGIMASTDASDEAKGVAERLGKVEESRTQAERADRYSPDEVLPVNDEWRDLYDEMLCNGEAVARRSHVTICGMARNIAGILPVTFARLGEITNNFGDFGVVIVENDSTDDTKAILKRFESQNPGRVLCFTNDFDWPHLHGFEPERVERYAMLRNTYREAVFQHFPHTDLILAVDLDCWGGWSTEGLLNGVGWMKQYKDAACMASTSLYQGVIVSDQVTFGHYDTWALRVHGWDELLLPWKTAWLPPPGSPPVELYSAFGAAAWYRPEALKEVEYASINGDIEHAGLHRRMIDNGWKIYLNPAQRSLMSWQAGDDAERKHSDDTDDGVSG